VSVTSDDDLFISGTDFNGELRVYRRHGSDAGWTRATLPMQPDLIFVDPRHPRIAVIDTITARQQMAVSLNNGITWNVAEGMPRGSVTDVAFTPKGRIIVGYRVHDTLRAGVVYSDDDAATWTRADMSDSVSIRTILVFSSSFVFAVGTSPSHTGDYVLQSFDGGHHWNVNSTFSFPDALVWLRNAPGDVFLANSLLRGLLRSSDYGRTWSSTDISDQMITAQTVYNRRVILVGSIMGGQSVLSASYDYGSSWKTISDRFSWGRILDIAVNLQGYIYVVTHEGTLHQSHSQELLDEISG